MKGGVSYDWDMYKNKTRKEYRKEHYWLHRDKYIREAAEWNRNNPGERKKIYNKNNKKSSIRKRIWKEQKTFDGNQTIIGKVCFLCGGTYRLSIHNKDGNNGRMGKNMNNSPGNLVVLCSRCHSSVHGWWGIKPI